MPYLYYCILAWGFASERLFKLQKRALRIIHRVKYNSHTDPLYKKSGLLKLNDIFKRSCIQFYYKYKHGNLPAHFNDFFTANYNYHGYNTRRNADLHRPACRLSRCTKSIRHFILVLYNGLPSYIKSKLDTHSLQSVANLYRAHLINQYPNICIVVN